MSDYSHRVKLSGGGRYIHAAFTSSDELTTLCGYVVDEEDTTLPNNILVTCRSCQRALGDDQ